MTKTRVRSRRLPLALALATAVSAAHGATITVNSADDDAASTFCNLRDAFVSINNGNTTSTPTCAAAVSGTFGSNNTIVFDNTLVASTISLGQGELHLGFDKNATLVGSGQTITAGHQSRALSLDQYAVLTASDVTLRDGTASIGGGVYLSWYSHLTLNRGTVANSSAPTGGGIFLRPFAGLALNASTVSGNSSSGPGGGIYSNSSSLQITASAISGNSADCAANYCGGGIHLVGGYLSVLDSTLSGNTVSAYERMGGAIYLAGSHVAFVTNSTITANSAFSHAYASGGIWQNSVGQLFVVNSTLSNNTVAGGTPIGGALVTGTPSAGGSYLTLTNSIVSKNTNLVPDVVVGSGTPHLIAQYDLLGSAMNVSAFNNAANHNIFSDAPALGPLQNNGGTTQTMALLPGSPALRAGSVALAAYKGQALHYDQRGFGFLRTFGGMVDIGAFQDQADRIFADGSESVP